MRKPIKEMEEYIRENLRYDPETGFLWWTKESEHRVGKKRDLDKPVGYAQNTGKYVAVHLVLTNRRVCYDAHRIAWFLHYGSWPKDTLDHINGLRTDNRVENLRQATDKENNRNKRSRAGSSSKYKGVSWHKDNQNWQARCNSKYLGSYTQEEEAARVFDKAARELHGDYARLNFPDEQEQGALHGHDV
jgi:hypothetical protein